MPKVLKIDLHTHPVAALKQQMGIRGIGDITKEVAFEIVKAVKAAGLNGIGITEKNNFNHSWVACLQIREYFRTENLIIIPGSESTLNGHQFLQLYIPPTYRKRMPFFKNKEWYYILANPGTTKPFDNNILNEVSFDAVEEKSLRGYFPDSVEISKQHHAALIQASDTYSLKDLGSFYMELQG
jgi:hypothetical protein